MRGQLTRRAFLGTVGTGAATLALAACSSSGDDAAGRDDTTQGTGLGPVGSVGAASATAPAITGDAAAYFEALGYQAQGQLPIVTAGEFNGGLRYDASPGVAPTTEVVDQRILRVQQCARTEDADATDPSVLAMFHQLDVRDTTGGVSTEQAITTAIDFLTTGLGLDVTRIGVVSTDLLGPFVPTLTGLGVPADQIVQRDREEAVAAGDGSGYFAPEGHTGDRGYTLSLHHRIDATDGDFTHPTPAGWIEVGEMMLNTGPQADATEMVWGFGLERLEIARDGSSVSPERSRQALLDLVRAEVEAGATPPPAMADHLAP